MSLFSAKRVGVAVGTIIGCLSLGWSQDLSVEERFLAQEIIDRFYYSHREGTKAAFEEVISREVIASKVESHLRKSETLRQLWGIEVTDEMVREELNRILRGTRMPQRLQALFQALGNDLRVVQESLVRPILVDRLARLAFASDAGLHAPARQKAESIREDLVRGAIDPHEDHPRRTVLPLNSETMGPRSVYSILDASLSGEDVRRIEASWLEPGLFDTWPSLMDAPNRSVGEIRETGRAFLVPVVLDRVLDGIELAVFAVEKEAWEDWWASAQHQCCAHFPLDLRGAVGRTSRHQAIDLSTLGRSTSQQENKGGILLGDSAPACGQDDTWSALSATANSPSAREIHTSVWTGAEMIIWGGVFRVGDTFSVLGDGAKYDPVLDTWTPISMTNAPTPRWLHSAVWAGDRMIVWGGETAGFETNTGAQYDTVSDSWTPTSTTDPPSERVAHSAVWTGDVMIIWGGSTVATHRIGGRYDPLTDTWESTAFLLAPTERYFHSAIWTGDRMVVWGGEHRFDPSTYLDTGGLYDPISDGWSVSSTTNVPQARSRHTAVWTGDRMIVWGGVAASTSDTGGLFDPVTDSWTATSLVNAPGRRYLHTAAWSGEEMIVWGGASDFFGSDPMNSGGRYDPSTDVWTATSTTNSPAPRQLHTVSSVGDLMFVWGGRGSATISLGDGGSYCACTSTNFYADGDGDGFGDDSTMISSCSAPQGYVLNNGDCDDSNGTVWSAPSEVIGLLLPDPSTLTWAPPASPGGTQPLYDVLRTTDPTDFVTAATCVSSDDPLTSTTDDQDPALGTVFFYDIRAETGCPGGGQGPLGSDSNGIPRAGRNCP